MIKCSRNNYNKTADQTFTKLCSLSAHAAVDKAWPGGLALAPHL